MSDIATLISCLSAGIAFAAIAAWLTTQRGNTISDILASRGGSADVLKVEIANKFKVATTLPIVALYLIAAVVALGLPAYSRYVACQHYEAWRVTGRVADTNTLQPVYVTMHPPHLPIDKDGTFDDEIPVRIDGDGHRIFPSITFTPNSPDYGPVVVHLHDDPPTYGQRIEGHEIHLATAIDFRRAR